eukprot:GHVH01005917.1.p1 GENE.GHVH01005917.1~~GHVH01005917.1.p1  ORF type:complete len:578 (-),score=86.97 GHVH01005917.1:3720-5453(-)
MSLTECPKCGSTEIDNNESTAELFCMKCGFILEQSQMVANVSFTSTSGGSKTTTGQFVGLAGGLSAALGTGATGSSREGILQRGFSGIQNVADSLRLSNQLVEGAQRMYALAINARLTMGRRRERVAAACLYTMCRRDKRPFLLIDFSDSLEIPVKKLGQTFMQLCRGLHIKEIPSVDPSLFMDRFTQQIPMITEKGMHREVAHSAMKVVQSMKRDWLCTGRRPNGIIGAALLIACRIHGFKINPEHLAHMCRISPATINYRLNEFRTTALALLQADKFDEVKIEELPQQRIPPALKRHQRRDALKLVGMPTRRMAIESLYERATLCDENTMPDISACISKWGEYVLENQDHDGIDQEMLAIGSEQERVSEANDVTVDDFSNMFLDNDSGLLPEDHNLFDLGSQYDVVDDTARDHNESPEQEVDDDPGDDVLTSDALWGGLLTCGNDDNVDDAFGDLVNWGEGESWNENTKDGGCANELAEELDVEQIEEVISDQDSDQFNCMLLSAQEKRAKALLWDELTKEILPSLYRRRFERQMKAECRLEMSARASRQLKANETEQFFGNMSGNDKDFYRGLF